MRNRAAPGGAGTGQRLSRVQGSASHGYRAAPGGAGHHAPQQASGGGTAAGRSRRWRAAPEPPCAGRTRLRAACGKPRGQCGPVPSRGGEPRSATPRPQARRQAPATAPPPGAPGPREPRAGPLRSAEPGMRGGGAACVRRGARHAARARSKCRPVRQRAGWGRPPGARSPAPGPAQTGSTRAAAGREAAAARWRRRVPPRRGGAVLGCRRCRGRRRRAVPRCRVPPL